MLVGTLIGFMLAVVLAFILAYLKFISLGKAVKTAWIRLDSRLKDRGDLTARLALSAAAIPELDRPFIYSLKTLRDECRQAATLPRRIACENEVTQKFKKVFTAACAHEELTKDEHFLKLQKNIIHAESRVQRAKRRYNSAVRDFNTLAEIIPLNLLVQMFEFPQYEYFDFDPSLEKVM